MLDGQPVTLKTKKTEKVQRRDVGWTTRNFEDKDSVSVMINDLSWLFLEQTSVAARLC